MQIWKFALPRVVTNQVVPIEMPKKAILLRVATQDEIPCIWAKIDPYADKETRFFYVAATGEDLPDGSYLGTVIQLDGAYVWHIFELPTPL